MNGYVLYESPDGAVSRFESHQGTRQALRRVLEEAVPDGLRVLGVVLAPREQSVLHLVQQAS